MPSVLGSFFFWHCTGPVACAELEEAKEDSQEPFVLILGFERLFSPVFPVHSL